MVLVRNWACSWKVEEVVYQCSAALERRAEVLEGVGYFEVYLRD